MVPVIRYGAAPQQGDERRSDDPSGEAINCDKQQQPEEATGEVRGQREVSKEKRKLDGIHLDRPHDALEPGELYDISLFVDTSPIKKKF